MFDQRQEVGECRANPLVLDFDGGNVAGHVNRKYLLLVGRSEW